MGAVRRQGSSVGIARMASSSGSKGSVDRYRRDGVRITHDPYAPGMAEKYGAPGRTDSDGFDPYADTVGAGIYGGTVERKAEDGSVVVGAQYQGHNPRPGPVYSGGGYSPVSRAIAVFRSEVRGGAAEEETSLARLLEAHPDLVNDVATGGATPLHTCGMSQDNQYATRLVVARGGDVAAIDTYGYTPLDRMASNNLAVGAKALLESGADPEDEASPVRIARSSRAIDVLDVLSAHGTKRIVGARVTSLHVYAPVRPEVAGKYTARPASDIPQGFSAVCVENGWDVLSTWAKLNGGEGGVWFAHTPPPESRSPQGLMDPYVYHNTLDGEWWIDGPDGLGVYKAPGPAWAPPGMSTAWKALDGTTHAPTLAIHRTMA